MRRRRRATIKGAETEAIQIKSPRREEKGDNKRAKQRLYRSRARRERRRATTKRAETKVVQIKGTQKAEKGRL